jgi:hypothetical protein
MWDVAMIALLKSEEKKLQISKEVSNQTSSPL